MKQVSKFLTASIMTCGVFQCTEPAIHTAHAASFDCAKASSKMEKAICGDAALSQLDEQLGGAYKTARSTLSPDASKKLTAGQQSWLAYTSKACFTNYAGSAA